MAHLLNHRHHRDDLCADLRGIVCPEKHHDHDHDDSDCPHHHHHHHHKLIPIARITVDCTPVVFETPGQAKTILC